jgi:hypothetical protein
MSKNKLLTKSKYIAGLESDCLLWRLLNDPQSLPAPDAFTQSKFDAGHEVGALAKHLYPQGLDLDDLPFMENIAATKDAVAHKQIIFEAGFLVDNLFARSDILIPVGDSWDVIEVKSSSSAKDVHVKDLAFQKYVLEKCGLSTGNFYVVHLNKEYVLQGDLQVCELFAKTDVTEDVLAEFPSVEGNVAHMKAVIALPTCPAFDYHDLIKSAYGNVCIDEFNASLPTGSIFELYNIRKKKAIELYDQGVRLLPQIPSATKLTDKQKIQVQCFLTNSRHVDAKNIQLFLDCLTYPLYHLDFETVMPVIPLFEGCKPNQQVPFQYSLHIEHADGTIDHREFLYTGEGDPRGEFLSSLQENLGDSGTVLVYNKAFELGRLRELASFDASFASWVEHITLRVIDLLLPFREFYFYDNRQKGSCSIKAILPVFSELDYASLAVSNGSEAMVLYYAHFVKGVACENLTQLREDLLAYCKQDTFAMVLLLRGLRELVLEVLEK